METKSPSCLDEIARRSKRNTRRKNGVKSESDEDYVPNTGAKLDVPSHADARRESSPSRPMANARKRRNCRQLADAKKSRKQMERTITPPSDCSDSEEPDQDASVSTIHDSTRQTNIDVCLSVVATMAADEPIHSEALKILVNHRLPTTIFASLQEYSDTTSWVTNSHYMKNHNASTVARVVQALERAEGHCIARALLDKFKSVAVIESVCGTLQGYCEGLRSKKNDSAEPLLDREPGPADPQTAAPRQAPLSLMVNDVHAETSSPAAEAALLDEAFDLPSADRLTEPSKSTTVEPTVHLPDTLAPEQAPRSMLPTLVEFVRPTKDDKLWYVMIPMNDSDLPIEDMTLHHIKQSCSAAFSWPIRFAKAEQLGDNVWYAAFTQRAFISKHHKVDLVEKSLWIRGRKCYTHYLPFKPPMLFAADVAMSNISTEEVMNHLAPALEARGLARPTLFETKSGKENSRRLVAHFHVNPNLLYFYVPVHSRGLAAPAMTYFWPVDPSSAIAEDTSL